MFATPTRHSTFFGAGGVNMLRKSEKHSKSSSPNVRERERETIHEMVWGLIQFISLSVCWRVVLLGVGMGGRIMKHGRDFRNNWNPLTTVGSKGWSDAHFLNSLQTLHAVHLFLLNRGVVCTVCTRNHAQGLENKPWSRFDAVTRSVLSSRFWSPNCSKTSRQLSCGADAERLAAMPLLSSRCSVHKLERICQDVIGGLNLLVKVA